MENDFYMKTVLQCYVYDYCLKIFVNFLEINRLQINSKLSVNLNS